MFNMIAPREAFGEALVELGKVNKDVVVLDADVGTSTKSIYFKKAFPDRFYQVGVAEQNMMGIAAGLSTLGFIPYACTFAVFASKRACDQVSISIAYPKLNVKISGAYGGIPTGRAGATHQAVEDIAIMRAMPNMKVIVPGDAVETKRVVCAASKIEGPVYIRTVRCPVPVLFDQTYDFELGKAVSLKRGNDVAIVSTGMMTAKAVAACEVLSREGIKARVVHMPSIKPIDVAAIVKAAEETAGIVTVENHSIIGGLGGAVAEVLAEHCPARMKRLGLRDHFGESGDNEAVFTKYRMNTPDIVEAAKALLGHTNQDVGLKERKGAKL